MAMAMDGGTSSTTAVIGCREFWKKKVTIEKVTSGKINIINNLLLMSV